MKIKRLPLDLVCEGETKATKNAVWKYWCYNAGKIPRIKPSNDIRKIHDRVRPSYFNYETSAIGRNLKMFLGCFVFIKLAPVEECGLFYFFFLILFIFFM